MNKHGDDIPDALRELYDRQHTDGTKKNYLNDLLIFYEWADHNKCKAVPCSPAVLIEFMLYRSDIDSLNTVKRRLSAVSWAHRSSGYLGEQNPRDHASVSEALVLLRKKYAEEDRAAPSGVAPLVSDIVREICFSCEKDPCRVKGARDRALCLLTFASGMRRSEIVALDLKDVEQVAEGLNLFLPKSKTDQEGRGQTKRVARGSVPLTCPVRALENWLELAGVDEGKVFRRLFKGGKVGKPFYKSGDALRRIIKGRLQEIGIEEWDEYSGHSFRSGFVTTSLSNGSSPSAIMDQTGHKGMQSLAPYIKIFEGWKNAASKNLDL